MQQTTTDPEIEAMQAAFDAMKTLQPEEQKRVLSWLAMKFQIGTSDTEADAGTAKSTNTGTTATKSSARGQQLSPKEFMDQKNPQHGVQRVACLAYYLTHSRNMRAFKKADLDALNTEAAQAVSIQGSDVANAERASNFVAKAGNGQKQITTRGEAVVNALPDQTKVDEVLKKYSLKRKRPSKRQTKVK